MSNYSQNFDSLTVPALPSGWTGSAFETTASPPTGSVSGSNALTVTTTGTNSAVYGTPDNTAGNVTVYASFNLSEGGGDGQQLQLCARGSSDLTTCYAVQCSYGSSGLGLTAVEWTSGSNSDAGGFTVNNPFASGLWYGITYQIEGSTHRVWCQRLSDGQWLQPGHATATWSSTFQPVRVFTNSDITGSGYTGIKALANTTSPSLYADDFSLNPVIYVESSTINATASLTATANTVKYAGNATIASSASLSVLPRVSYVVTIASTSDLTVTPASLTYGLTIAATASLTASVSIAYTGSTTIAGNSNLSAIAVVGNNAQIAATASLTASVSIAYTGSTTIAGNANLVVHAKSTGPSYTQTVTINHDLVVSDQPDILVFLKLVIDPTHFGQPVTATDSDLNPLACKATYDPTTESALVTVLTPLSSTVDSTVTIEYGGIIESSG